MKKILLLSIIFLLLSCKDSTKTDLSSNDSPKAFSAKKTLSLSNPDNMFLSFLSQVRQKDKYFELYRLRHRASEKQGIDIYKIRNDTTISKKTIVLNDAQKRKLKRLRGFFIDQNNIFLLGINKYIILDLNTKETIKEGFYNNPKNNKYFPIAVDNISPAFTQNRKLYLTRIVDLDPSDSLYKSNTLMCYDMQSDSLYEMKHTNYPQSYFGKCWSYIFDLFPYFTRNNHTLIYSFPINDTLFIYDIDKQVVKKKVIAKYPKKNKEVSPIPCDEVWNSQTASNHLNENYLYRQIIYDSFRKIYYRFVYLPNKNYNPNKKSDLSDSKFVIMVFDKDFNNIANSKILNVKPTYIPFDYFVTKEGLWLSTNNPKNPSYNEDELHFELFNLDSASKKTP